MSSPTSAWNHFKRFDELALGGSAVHRLHPVAKVVTALFFLVTVVSFGKYEVAALLPLVFYPVVLIALSDLPCSELLKRTCVAAPFALGIGVFNLFFDTVPMASFGKLILSGGCLSFISIILRVGLTALAALILIATSGMGEIAAALIKMKVPRPLVVQILFMYRYLSVLGEESARVLRASSLRSGSDKGIPFKMWGSLVGQLLLRTIDRSERIYWAMLCRGFDGEVKMMQRKGMRVADGVYMGVWLAFFIVVRLVNLPDFIGRILTGVGR